MTISGSSSVALCEEPIPLPAPNWSRPLPRPIIIPDVMELETLADVWILVEKHLPACSTNGRRTPLTAALPGAPF